MSSTSGSVHFPSTSGTEDGRGLSVPAARGDDFESAEGCETAEATEASVTFERLDSVRTHEARKAYTRGAGADIRTKQPTPRRPFTATVTRVRARFTDNPIQAEVTAVRAVNFTELRDRSD